MISCKEMAEILNWAAVRAKNELDVPTEVFMEAMAKEAKEWIGFYHPGWAPLAESTLEGWHGHPGKIELGYAPPDNPLLRTGDMRDSIQSQAELASYGAEGVIGSESKIALYQEMGTSKIPPRPFLGGVMSVSGNKAKVVFGEFAVKVLTR